MANNKLKRDFKVKTEKIDSIYQEFLTKIKKLQDERDKVILDFVKKSEKESVEKLKKHIESLYK